MSKKTSPSDGGGQHGQPAARLLGLSWRSRQSGAVEAAGGELEPGLGAESLEDRIGDLRHLPSRRSHAARAASDAIPASFSRRTCPRVMLATRLR